MNEKIGDQGPCIEEDKESIQDKPGIGVVLVSEFMNPRNGGQGKVKPRDEDKGDKRNKG
jgi:hypothetical protein